MAFGRGIRGGLSNLYVGRSTFFKAFLVGGVLLISGLFTWYTLSVIEQLQLDTRDQVDRYVRLWQMAANSPTSGDELPLIFDEIILKATIPMIVLDQDRRPVSWRNIPGVAPDDTTKATMERLVQVSDDMFRHNKEYPLYFGETVINYLRYGDSEVIGQLRIMPFIAIGIVVAFLIVTLIGFQNIRRSEERFIWVGMAKETAHQLGTPLTSLLGWLEVVGSQNRGDLSAEEFEQLVDSTVTNMRMDVKRLERVANRFGQIGSTPEMKETDLNVLVAECVQYYRARLPFEGQGTQLVVTAGNIPPVRLGRVNITTGLSPDGSKVVLEIADNGHGIPVRAAKKIFHPGFTTKKRGWGMGLTLVKRIVEEYHVGRIVLLRSQPGETVFQVTLPVSGGV
jgi:hypothetical protein